MDNTTEKTNDEHLQHSLPISVISAIPYTLNEDSSLSSDDDGPDVYVPPYAIPSMSISNIGKSFSIEFDSEQIDHSDPSEGHLEDQGHQENIEDGEKEEVIDDISIDGCYEERKERTHDEHMADEINCESSVSICGLSQDKETKTKLDNFRSESDKQGSGNIIKQTEIDCHMAEETEIKGKDQNREVKQMDISKEKENSEWKKMDDDECSSTFTTKLGLEGTCHVKTGMCESDMSEVTKAMSEDTTQEDKLVDKSNASQVSCEGEVQLQTNRYNETKESENNTHDSVRDVDKSLIVDNELNLERGEKQNVKAVNRVEDETAQNKIESKEHPSVPIKPVNAVNYNPGRVGQWGQFQYMPPNYPYYNVGALHQPGLPQPYHPLSPPYTGFHMSPLSPPPPTGYQQQDLNGRKGDKLITYLSSDTSKLPVSPTNKKVEENKQFESEINPDKTSWSATTNHDKPFPGLLPDKELADNKMVPDKASTQGSKIVITCTGDISEYTLRYYFENTRKSGGGEIEDMDFSPDTGVAVVEFKDKESAANVLKKQNVHKVSDVELKIHVIEQEADMSRWLEEEKVFVTGVMNTTTEDCLNDYIEVKSGAEPTNISYGRDKTSALITFEDKVDFTKLRTGCLMKALEGSTLTVSRVPVTRTVLVSGIGHDSGITNDTVRYYFENKRRSSGHEEAEILEYDSDTCVIRFPSPAVARRVCDKTQKIGERTLEVCLFYEFLGKPGKALEIPEPEIISADFNILKFIRNLPNMKEDFEKKLGGLYGHVEWPEDLENDEVKIMCDLDLSTSDRQKAVESWQTDINNCTEEFISTLTTMRITTLPEAWGEVVKELRTMIIADTVKAYVILEKENHDILMVGDRNIIKELYQDIQKIVSRSEGRSTHTETTPTKVLSFKKYKLQLLWLLKYFDVVVQKYPGLEAKCNLDAREVTLSGNVESMQAVELFLRETTNSFVVKTFKMSKQKKDLLFKKGAREVWYQEAKTKQIIATWNIDRGHVCEMYANSKKEAARAIICIEDLFLEDELVVDENYEDFIQSSQWTELQVRLTERDENCFCVRTDRGRIKLAATKYIFQEIKLDIQKEIDDFSKLHCRYTKTINCDKGIHLYIRHNHQKEIQKIEKTLKSMDVKITSDNQNYSYEIKGNKTGITLASSKLDALMKTIHSDKHKLHSYGIREYFLSPPGKKETVDIGKKHSSVVLQETDYSEEKARRAEKGGELRLSAPGVKRVFMHDEVHKIYLVEGDITQLDVDAIVNASNNDMDHCGGLAKAIADAAGKTVQDECHEYVKKNGQVRDGDAIYSKPGKLPCKMIIHAVGPVWKGGNQGERNLLKAAVLECLALTEQRSYKTVAIPALSGGIFGYPLDDCTITIVETIKEYFDQNGSTTTVTGVYLCDISGETIKLFQDALQDAYSNEKSRGKGKHRYPDEQRTLKYPGHESDLKPIRYPDTQADDAPSNPIRYPHSGEPTSGYPSDRSNHNTASRDTSSGSDSDFIKVVKGLLTQRKVDVIVNSVSHSLDLSRGRLSKSILGAAGDIIQTEIYQYIRTFQPFQNVAVTSGGNMPCKNIVHGVLAPFDGLETKSVKILQMFILMCLNSASDHKMTSIAFPAIGTGVLNFPVDIVAKTMFEIVLLYKQKVPDSSIKSVEFVIYPEDTAAVRAFEDEQRKVRRKTSSQTITDKDINPPWLVDDGEFKRMLSWGEFLSYENRLSLGGPCQAGKSTLASVLIGEEIPLHWNSTDGLVIYFGRNGIDIKNKRMVPLKKGKRRNEVLTKVLRGKPDVYQKFEQTTRQKIATSLSSSNTAIQTEKITFESSINAKPGSTIAPRNSPVQSGSKSYEFMTKSVLEHTNAHISNKGMASSDSYEDIFELKKLQLQSDILDEVRSGRYTIEIAPSDLIDFGGQKSYDMIHQLFIQHRGSFLLIFDGRFGLNNQLDGYPEGITAASVMKHWVDSVLTYIEDTEDIMPMILFAATHRDQCKEDTSKLKESFIIDIQQMFSEHENKKHLHLDTVYFINGLDRNDIEIKQMTDQVVMFAMQQSSWGKRRPMQWVPLELQISNMRMRNINILTKEDLHSVNKMNGDLALDERQLNDFLTVQHSIGKLMYYKLPGLDKFVIIHPPALVNILRSFVTDEMFFPADPTLRSILQTLTETGTIYRKNLLKLWQQDSCQQYMPNITTKEFVLKLLVHLDILIIPKRTEQTLSAADVYLVPCMIKAIKAQNFNSLKHLGERTICLRYSLARHSIPTALAYKIIGGAVNTWPLKTEDKKTCMYHKAAILNVSEDNELRIWFEDNRVMIYMTNHKSLFDISPDVAASVQECLTRSLESSLLFHYNSLGRKIKPTEVSELYTMDVGVACDIDICFRSLQDANKIESWICKKGTKHQAKYLLYWIFNKAQEKCEDGCKGLTENELRTEPSEKHLVRLGSLIGIGLFREFFINLGMEQREWESTNSEYCGHSCQGIMAMALKQWKNSKLSKLKKPTLKELYDALSHLKMDKHLLCQIFREKSNLFAPEIANSNLQAIPTKQQLKELSNEIGNCPLQLGIELGLSFTEVEQSLFRFPKDLPCLLEDILVKWEKKSKVKTIHSLMLALERVNTGGLRYLLEISKVSDE